MEGTVLERTFAGHDRDAAGISILDMKLSAVPQFNRNTAALLPKCKL